MASKKKRTLKKSSLRSGEIALAKIERLLGEEFESLAQAKRALKLETKPTQKIIAKQGKQLKQLSRTLSRAKNIEQQSKELDRLAKKLSKGLPKQLPKGGGRTEGKRIAAKEPVQGSQRRQSVPVSKQIPTPKREPKKKAYTINELRAGQKKSIENFLKDETNAEQLTRNVLRPGEYIGLEIPNRYTGLDLKTHKGYAKSYALYNDFKPAFKRLSSYLTYGKFGRFGSGLSRQSFINGIKIIKFGEALPKGATEKQKVSSIEQASSRWFAMKKAETDERENRKRTLKQRLKTAEKRVRELERERTKRK